MSRRGEFDANVSRETTAEMDEAIGRRLRVLDPEKVANSIREAFGALDKSVAALKAADFSEGIYCKTCEKELRAPLSPRDLAQVTAYTAKVVDMVYRLFRGLQQGAG